MTGKGGNELLSECPGYEKYKGNPNKYKDTAYLFRAMKKPPLQVRQASKSAKIVWQDLLLIGTPREVALDLLDEPEFWATVKEYDKPRRK